MCSLCLNNVLWTMRVDGRPLPPPRPPGPFVGGSAVVGGSPHSASRRCPTSGSTSVPSLETLISRSVFQGFRRCLVRLKGNLCTRIHSTETGEPHCLSHGCAA